MKKSEGMDRREFLKFVGMTGALSLPLLNSSLLFGANWPTKPIKLSIGYAIGGGGDVFTRGPSSRAWKAPSRRPSRRATCPAPWRRSRPTLS